MTNDIIVVAASAVSIIIGFTLAVWGTRSGK